MTGKEFFYGIPERLRWKPNVLTVIEFLALISLPFIVTYANPAWFVENGPVENLQLVVLLAAFGLTFKVSHDKNLFTALALVIVLMLMRETNLGRAFFCERYLSPEEMCRWHSMKYGFIVEPLRNLYGLYILYYIWRKKVYLTIWQYVLRAPIYIWDLFFLFLCAVLATVAEMHQIDNEVLEESGEMLFYWCFVNCIYRYRNCI